MRVVLCQASTSSQLEILLPLFLFSEWRKRGVGAYAALSVATGDCFAGYVQVVGRMPLAIVLVAITRTELASIGQFTYHPEILHYIHHSLDLVATRNSRNSFSDSLITLELHSIYSTHGRGSLF